MKIYRHGADVRVEVTDSASLRDAVRVKAATKLPVNVMNNVVCMLVYTVRLVAYLKHITDYINAPKHLSFSFMVQTALWIFVAGAVMDTVIPGFAIYPFLDSVCLGLLTLFAILTALHLISRFTQHLLNSRIDAYLMMLKSIHGIDKVNIHMAGRDHR